MSDMKEGFQWVIVPTCVCLHCGETTADRDAMRAHIETCEKHPLYVARSENRLLREMLEEMAGCLQNVMSEEVVSFESDKSGKKLLRRYTAMKEGK